MPLTQFTITSAFALNDTQRKKVRLIAKKIVKSDDFAINEVVDKSLIAGIKINSPSIEFDASFAKKLELIKKQLLKEIK